MFHLLYYLVYWDAVHEKFIFHVASNIWRLYHLESIYSNTPGAVFSFQTVLQLSLATTMNHNFWAVEKPLYFFPNKLHTFWKMTENSIIPSAILLEFLYQFEQYFCFNFVIFYVCFINASRKKKSRHFQYQKPNFVTMSIFIALFSVQFHCSPNNSSSVHFQKETKSPEIRGIFFLPLHDRRFLKRYAP